MSFLRPLFGSDEPSAPAYADAGDRMLIDHLRQSGADLSQPREVIHYLYLPSQEAATAAAERLRREGYTTEVRPAAGAARAKPMACAGHHRTGRGRRERGRRASALHRPRQ